MAQNGEDFQQNTPPEALYPYLYTCLLTEEDAFIWRQPGAVALLRYLRDNKDPRLLELKAAAQQHAKIYGKDFDFLVGSDPLQTAEVPVERYIQQNETTGDSTKEMPWLWFPYIPRVGLTFIDGDPGIGKTTLCYTLAAIISNGWPFPDQYGKMTLPSGRPSTTLYFSNENSLEYSIKPGLAMAQANRERVWHLEGVYNHQGKEGAFTLSQECLPLLEDRLKEHHPALVIFDPIQSYLGSKVDLHRSNETRPVLDHLTALSERYECAIIGLRHPAKAGGDYGRLLYRGQGSMDLAGAARSVLFCEQHPQKMDAVLLLHAKSNREYGCTHIFTTEGGRFSWKGITRVTAQTFERSRGPTPHALMEAVFWLESVLTETPTASKDIMERAEAEGISEKTLKAARRELGVKSTQTADGWNLALPVRKILKLPLYLPGLQGILGVSGTSGSTGTSDSNINTLSSEVLINAVDAVDPEVPVSPDVSSRDASDYRAYDYHAADNHLAEDAREKVTVCRYCGSSVVFTAYGGLLQCYSCKREYTS